MKTAPLVPLVLTMAAITVYFSPWYAPNPWTVAPIHYAGLLWLLIAWIFVPIQGYLAFRAKRRKEAGWRSHAVSSGAIAALSVTMLVAISKGYVVSV